MTSPRSRARPTRASFVLGVLGALFGCRAPVPPAAPPTSHPDAALAELVAAYDRLERALDPVTAGSDGDRAALARLPDVRPATLDTLARERRALGVALASIDVHALAPEAQLDHRLLTRVIAMADEEHALDLTRIAFQNDDGFHTLGDYLGRTTVVRDRNDAEAWLARLAALPAYYAQNVDNLRRGGATGLTQPRVVVERVLAVARRQAAQPLDDSPLLAPFAKLPDSLSPAEQAALRTRAVAEVRDRIQPAQRAFADFLAHTYLPAARSSLGLRSAPGGEAMYRFLVRRETTTALSPEEIHALGLREVARIRSRMDEAIAASGFRGSFSEFLRQLRSDPRFYPTSEEALLDAARAMARRADAQLPRVVTHLPSLRYEVLPVPAEIAEGYTSGRYWPGSLKRGQPASYRINTTHLDQRPLYELPALTLHEAVPGHHLQIALSQERGTLPYFRRNAMVTAFVEGWALYAEYLGEELGLYRDAYELFGRYSFEMWRACRLVADTGIHWLGWDLETARRCFTDNSALAPHNIETELERYVSWPAQALAYKVGELRLRALRESARAALSERFDARRFHEAVLAGGALPLDVLDAQIDAFIARERARQPPIQNVPESLP